jgi:hypothetical protein
VTEISLLSYLPALGIDLFSIILIAYIMYYRRYRKRELTIAIAVINIVLFALGGALASFTLSLGVGFALFAVISVIRLRSDTAGWLEMSYMLIGLSVGLILGLPAYSLGTQVVYAFTLMLALIAIDNPWLLPIRGKETMNVAVNFVETDIAELRNKLTERLALEVTEVTIKSISLQPEAMKVDVKFKGL